MNESERRALIRAVIDRHLAGVVAQPPSAQAPSVEASRAGVQHASHQVYVTLVNTGDACFIEPGVACNHCNYCRSHGH